MFHMKNICKTPTYKFYLPKHVNKILTYCEADASDDVAKKWDIVSLLS